MIFSIIVPVYNVEKYIRECMNSILKQNFRDFEVILIDDGSTDASGKICDEYSSKYENVRVVHKDNQGLISARREGFRNANGKYIVNCDSDDYLEQNALDQLYGIFMKYDPDMIIYNSYITYEDHKDTFAEHIFDEGMVSTKELIYDSFLLTYEINSLCMKSYKRSIVDIDKDYSSCYGLSYGEDLLQSVPLVINAGTIYYLDRKLYNYRQSSGMMFKYNNKQYWSFKEICSRMRNMLLDVHLEELEYKISKFLVQAGYSAIHVNYLVGEFHEEDIKSIIDDRDFIDSYNLIKNTDYMNLFTKKQRIELNIIEHRWYWLLKLMYGIYNFRK